MVQTNFRIRRATLDDLGQLTALWRAMTYNPGELAPRITEFQVAEAENGVVVGALGLQILERQGLVHNEAFTDFSLADPLRPLFWERMQTIAASQGLLRFWTREQAPFWGRNGMIHANEESLAHLPVAWRAASGPWLTLKLRDDLDAVMKADQQFSIFMQMERQKTARTLRRAKVLKALALSLAWVLVIFALGAAFYLFWKHQHPPG